MKRMKCCICHREFEGYGNNPFPYETEGRCCDECNRTKVVPARMADIHNAIRADGTIRPEA